MQQFTTKPALETFTLEAALVARDQGTFPQWLDAFLRGSGTNVPLADGLRRDQRWWIGPVEIELSQLTLKCGPGLEYHEEEASWNARIGALAAKIGQGLKVPPLIAEYKDGMLFLADGNHRYGALQLSGLQHYWTAIWFNSKEDFDSFVGGR